MLTNGQRRRLAAILDGFSTLERIAFDLEKREATLEFMIQVDCNEHGEIEETGQTAPEQYRAFRLKGVKTAGIDPGKEIMPRELDTRGEPSSELFQFLVSIFDHQAMYEWSFFRVSLPANASSRVDLTTMPSREHYAERWLYVLDPDISGREECIELYKERGGNGRWGFSIHAALWRMRICFHEFEVIDPDPDLDPLPLEEFFGLYPRRIARRVN